MATDLYNHPNPIMSFEQMQAFAEHWRNSRGEDRARNAEILASHCLTFVRRYEADRRGVDVLDLIP